VNGPNLLSISRIALAAPVAWAILEARTDVAVMLLAVALVTDFLDGALARRSGASTVLGLVLDPVADKVLVAAVLAALAVRGLVPVELAWCVVLRDVGLLAAGWIRMRGGGGVPRAQTPGKVAFTVLGIYLGGVVLGMSWPSFVAPAVGVLYVLAAFGYLRRLPRPEFRRVAKGER
jgi:cardiolipin synthase